MHYTKTLINLLDLKNSNLDEVSVLEGIYTKQQIANFKIIMVVKVGYKLYCFLICYRYLKRDQLLYISITN